MKEPDGNWYSWPSRRVTSGHRVEGREKKGPGLSYCLRLLQTQGGPTILSPFGEGPSSSRQADS